jgi:hypothetical protein
MEEKDLKLGKPFVIQMTECKSNGTAVYESCPRCSQQFLMCKRHWGYCVSSKCRKERMNIMKDENL